MNALYCRLGISRGDKSKGQVVNYAAKIVEEE